MLISHDDLVDRGCRYLRGRRRCWVVLAERSGGGEIPDAIGWTSSGVSILVEAKISRTDFFADAGKTWRKSGLGMGRERYYIVPDGLVGPGEVPEAWGLLTVKGSRVQVRKDATRMPLKPEAARRETALLVNELSRYQRCNVKYPYDWHIWRFYVDSHVGRASNQTEADRRKIAAMARPDTGQLRNSL